jgi:hypothetical protein
MRSFASLNPKNITPQLNPLSEDEFFKCLYKVYVNTAVTVRLFVLPGHVLKGMINKQITLCVILLQLISFRGVTRRGLLLRPRGSKMRGKMNII